jgi:hypothetical protein
MQNVASTILLFFPMPSKGKVGMATGAIQHPRSTEQGRDWISRMLGRMHTNHALGTREAWSRFRTSGRSEIMYDGIFLFPAGGLDPVQAN